MNISDEAVEAAAPHLMAQAWGEGWSARDVWPEVTTRNPYRSVGAGEEVAAAFANREATMRALVARAAGADPETARRLGYGPGGSAGAGE